MSDKLNYTFCGMSDLFCALLHLCYGRTFAVHAGAVPKGRVPLTCSPKPKTTPTVTNLLLLMMRHLMPSAHAQGKSTLANHLLKRDRSLTGPEPGLTRDTVRSSLQYGGHTIQLADTAGWLKRAQLQRPSDHGR